MITPICCMPQDFVDQHLISSGQQPAIKPVMGGRFVQQIICRGVDFTSEREEDFYQISVDVKGMGSLEKSLDDYVKVGHRVVLVAVAHACDIGVRHHESVDVAWMGLRFGAWMGCCLLVTYGHRVW